MGAEAALDAGHIDLKDYPKIKSAIDLYKACTQPVQELRQLDNLWIYGKPGVVIEKDKSKYWNGYTNQETVLIDDLE